MRKHFNLKIYGHVQGVFFRAFVLDNAEELGISGFVRNEPDGSVYVEAEGDEEILGEFLNILKHGPRSARVEEVEAKDGDIVCFEDFKIQF